MEIIYVYIYVYIIYTPNLGLGIAVSVRERESDRFQGSKKGVEGSKGEYRVLQGRSK